MEEMRGSAADGGGFKLLGVKLILGALAAIVGMILMRILGGAEFVVAILIGIVPGIAERSAKKAAAGAVLGLVGYFVGARGRRCRESGPGGALRPLGDYRWVHRPDLRHLAAREPLALATGPSDSAGRCLRIHPGSPLRVFRRYCRTSCRFQVLHTLFLIHEDDGIFAPLRGDIHQSRRGGGERPRGQARQKVRGRRRSARRGLRLDLPQRIHMPHNGWRAYIQQEVYLKR